MNQSASIVVVILAILTSCAWPVSDTQQSEIAEAIILAHLDTVYAWVNRDGIEGESRVLLLQGLGVNEAVRDEVRRQLRFPFLAVRSDSSEIEITYKTAYTKEGKPFQYTATSRDKWMDVPIRGLYVDSLRSQKPGSATALLYETDVEGTHFQGLKWWLKRSEKRWRVDSVRVIWIN